MCDEICCGEWVLELFADNGELINRIRSQTRSPQSPAGVEWSAQAPMENPFHEKWKCGTYRSRYRVQGNEWRDLSLHRMHNAVSLPCRSFFRPVESTREQQRSRHRTDPFHSALHCAGNRRAGGEKWEWHGGHRCYRYPRRGIAAHVTAVGFFFPAPWTFHATGQLYQKCHCLHTDVLTCAAPAAVWGTLCSHWRRVGTLYPHCEFRQLISDIKKLLIYWLIFPASMHVFNCRHPDHNNRPEHQLPPRVCR